MTLANIKNIVDLSGTGQTTGLRLLILITLSFKRNGAVMTHVLAAERRVSNVTDRRRVPGRGGRRANDHRDAELDLRVSCEGCGTAWASLSSFTYERGRPARTIAVPDAVILNTCCPPFQPLMVNPDPR